MTKKRNTKRALLASIVTMMLCMIMLIGSTFAWFTDTDTVAVNQIVAGNLDVEIVDASGNVKEDALKFLNENGESNILWEPGATFRTEGFSIKNNGNLALKYKIEINNTEVSYNKLNEVIEWSIVYKVGDVYTKVDLDQMADMQLAPTVVESFHAPMYLEGHMREDAGNEYQGLTMDGISITVYATQVQYENDSNGNTYDKDAIYDDEIASVATADDFMKAFAELEEGGTVVLTEDIDLTGKNWSPVNNKSFTLDGNGKKITGMSDALVGTTAAKEYTVKNVTFEALNINACYGGIAVGLISYADTCSYINMENVTINNANITGAEYVGGFAGYTSGYGVDTNGPVNASHNFTNCKITNSTLTSSTDGSTGGLIGHAGSNAATTTRINGFAYENLTLKQTESRPDKIGNMIGTANVGIVYVADADIVIADDIGRFVPGTTGKLVVNGEEIAAYDGK